MIKNNTKNNCVAILASGNGSNFQAVIDAIEQGELDIQVCVLLTDVSNAYAIERARKAHISYIYLKRYKDEPRIEYDKKLCQVVRSFNPDFVFLLGWQRILTKYFLEYFSVVNLHPALPNTFVGLHCIEKQFTAFQRDEISDCGIMTHYVPTEEVDAGPVIFSEKVLCFKGETLEAFENRVHSAEHKLVVKTLKHLCSSKQ